MRKKILSLWVLAALFLVAVPCQGQVSEPQCVEDIEDYIRENGCTELYIGELRGGVPDPGSSWIASMDRASFPTLTPGERYGFIVGTEEGRYGFQYYIVDAIYTECSDYDPELPDLYTADYGTLEYDGLGINNIDRDAPLDTEFEVSDVDLLLSGMYFSASDSFLLLSAKTQKGINIPPEVPF